MFCNYNLFLLENDFNPSFYTRLSEITSALKNLGLKLLHVVLQGEAFIQAFLSTAYFPKDSVSLRFCLVQWPLGVVPW